MQDLCSIAISSSFIGFGLLCAKVIMTIVERKPKRETYQEWEDRQW